MWTEGAYLPTKRDWKETTNQLSKLERVHWGRQEISSSIVMFGKQTER